MVVYSVGAEANRPLRVTLRGILVVIGGIIVHLTIGSFFTFGNFSPYIISYMRQRTGEATLRNVDGVWVSSLGPIFGCFGMTLGGLIERRFGPRLATAGGCIFFTACVGCSALTIQHSFILFAVSYGACYGIATLMVYGPTISTAIKWFPNRRAMVAGCVLCGFGGSSIIFNQVITGYINPDNLSPEIITEDGERYFGDPELLDRVPLCFLLLGGIYASMEIIGCLLIKLPPKLEDDTLVVTNLELGMTKENVSKTSDSVTTEQLEERSGREETSIHCTSLDNQSKDGEKVNGDSLFLSLDVNRYKHQLPCMRTPCIISSHHSLHRPGQ